MIAFLVTVYAAVVLMLFKLKLLQPRPYPEAKFNLAQCTMTAPSDGYVVTWQVQEGTMLVPMRTAAAGTFVDTTSISVLAAFPQNYLTNVRSGDEVELVLDAHPGQVFKGSVDTVVPASGGGQFNERRDTQRREGNIDRHVCRHNTLRQGC
jgi:multidrug resistance efflux pump